MDRQRQKNKVRRKIDETQELLENILNAIGLTNTPQVNVMLSVMGMRGKMFTSKVSKQMTLMAYEEPFDKEQYIVIYEVFVNPIAFKKHTPQTLAEALTLDYKTKSAKL